MRYLSLFLLVLVHFPETSAVFQGDCLGKFQCKTDTNQTQVCIPMNQVCDGKKDCPNGDDESSKCTECAHKNCEHICHNTPTGAQCSCLEGFKLLSNGFECDDDDQCVEHDCQHYCEDRFGSYICKCAEGYKLNPDDHTCRSEYDFDQALFASIGNELWEMELEPWQPKNKTARLASNGNITSIDIVGDSVFMAIDTNLTRYSNGTTQVLRENVIGLGHIAADWIGSNIYFTQPSGISVCSVNGTFCRRLVHDATEIYSGLVVHPTRGLMFWIEKDRVMVANMDGSEVRQFVDSHQPSAMAIDYIRHDIYIANEKYIECYNIDTKKRSTVLSISSQIPNQMAYFNGYLYWADRSSTKVKMLEIKYNDTRLVKSFDGIPYGLAIRHSNYQPKIKPNPCNCKWLCIPIPTSDGTIAPKCVCPDHYQTINGTCIPPISDEVGEGYTRIGSELMAKYCDDKVACRNGGWCVDGVHHKKCECKKGFRGTFCEYQDPKPLSDWRNGLNRFLRRFFKPEVNPSKVGNMNHQMA